MRRTRARDETRAMFGARAVLGMRVDAAGCAAFRIALGALLAYSSVRFWANGWIEAQYVAPRFHFAYPGFEWITPHPPWGLNAHFAVMTLAALGVALGALYRWSALALFLSFTWVELIDQSYYLNHYYLVSLLCGLACVLPLHRVGSIDAWRARRRGAAWPQHVAIAVPWLLRAQLGVVYFFAGVAKLDSDWLLRAEPLRTWLFSHGDAPLVGPFLQTSAAAYALSWAGALFDLSVAFLLCVRGARPFAYAAVVAFHAATGLLFPIGVFPLVMIALTLIFFPHDWPRRFFGGAVSVPAATGAPLSRAASSALALYLALQLLFPLRHLAYPGPVNWTEEGFRFAWRVMLIEKTGHVELRVHEGTRQLAVVQPSAELTRRQAQILSSQPDMIAQYARHIAKRYRARGHVHVRVYADAFASLNGRPVQRLLDPDADLGAPRSLLHAWFQPNRAIAPLHH